MAWPSARYRTAERGGSWGWDAMNGVQDWLLRPNGLTAEDAPVLDIVRQASHTSPFAVSTRYNTDNTFLSVRLPSYGDGLCHAFVTATYAPTSFVFSARTGLFLDGSYSPLIERGLLRTGSPLAWSAVFPYSGERTLTVGFAAFPQRGPFNDIIDTDYEVQSVRLMALCYSFD